MDWGVRWAAAAGDVGRFRAALLMGVLDERAVGQMWDANAPEWIEFSRAGYDVYRDLVNTPAFLAMLPDVGGMVGLDVGCGEGHNTRLLADRGARLVGVDIAPVSWPPPPSPPSLAAACDMCAPAALACPSSAVASTSSPPS